MRKFTVFPQRYDERAAFLSKHPSSIRIAVGCFNYGVVIRTQHNDIVFRVPFFRVCSVPLTWPFPPAV